MKTKRKTDGLIVADQMADESMPFDPPEEPGSGQNTSVDGGSDERKKAIRTCKTCK